MGFSVSLHLSYKKWLFFVLSSAYLVVFIQNVAITVVTPDVMRDLGLSSGDMGLLGSAYLYAYALTQVFSGILSTRFGPRRLLSCQFLVAALGGFLFATAHSLPMAVAGRLLNGLGNRYPSLTGNGQMMPGVDVTEKESPITLPALGIGLVAALSFFVAGQILGKFVPLHPYALMIVLVALLKVCNLVPESINDASAQWFRFVARNWTFALLFGIGVAFTDLGQVIDAISLTYVLIVFAVVAGAAFGAGLVGKLVGFYPIESAITAGLCMANMGGTGDVAVLSAARRMSLMPFAQISSRLGGALILLISSVVVPLFFT